MLNALAFRHLGVDLFTLRIVLLGFFLAWVPALYFLASEITSDVAAAGITLLAVAWSVPNYAAAMPSWYNLFFATFGAAALVRHQKTGAPPWLFAAGLCAGLSFLAKVSGLYFLAAVLVYFVFREQSASTGDAGPMGSRPLLYFGFVVASCASLVMLLLMFVSGRLESQNILNYVLPGALLGLLLILREGKRRGTSSGVRFRRLIGMAMPFLGGALLPIALFVVPYLMKSSTNALVMGLFVLPAKRIAGAQMMARPVATLLPLLGLVGLVALAAVVRESRRRWVTAALILLFAALFAASFRSGWAYETAWHTAEGVIPLITALAVFRLLGFPKSAPSLSIAAEDRMMLLASVTAFCSLVQFPFAAPIYFCYVAPLAVLTSAAALQTLPAVPKAARVSLAGYYFVFAVFLFTPGFIYNMGWRYSPDRQTARLDLPRAGRLRVSPETAEEYERVVPLILQHSAGSGILAGPDCPEIYFLAGRRNPTRMLFDFFEDAAARKEQLLRLTADPSIKVLVVNTRPSFSEPYPKEWHDAMTKPFAAMEKVGKFEVWWRP
jgi:hypothetical protein